MGIHDFTDSVKDSAELQFLCPSLNMQIIDFVCRVG